MSLRFTKTELDKEIGEGFVGKGVHPNLPITVYNYTAKAQYDNHWNEVTESCRGLWLTDSGEVVARPFRKFFNLSQFIGPLPEETYEITEKIDGSLIVIALYNGEPVISSRGSFVSDQAVKAKEIIKNHYPNLKNKLKKGRTYLFEIVFPENRIVVDYGKTEDLFLLAIIDNDTGRDLQLEELGPPIREARNFEEPLTELPFEPNKEGYVVRFSSGLRLKVKSEEYVRLHRLLTQVNSKDIYEWVRDGRDLGELLNGVPDEFYTFVKKEVKFFNDEFSNLEKKLFSAWEKIPQGGERKVSALAIMQEEEKLRPALFCLLSKKEYASRLWKLLVPESGEVKRVKFNPEEAGMGL